MLMKTKAIVLHAFKFGENKLMVDVFTEQQGRISFAVRIVNSPKAKIKKQYFQPFSVLEIEYDYRQKTNIQTFNNVGIAYPFGSIPFEPLKLSICFFLAELICSIISFQASNGLTDVTQGFLTFTSYISFIYCAFLAFIPTSKIIKKGVVLICVMVVLQAHCRLITIFFLRKMPHLLLHFHAWTMPICTFLRCHVPIETAFVISF